MQAPATNRTESRSYFPTVHDHKIFLHQLYGDIQIVEESAEDVTTISFFIFLSCEAKLL